MNLILVNLFLIVLYSTNVFCRPQTVQVEKQSLLHLNQAIIPDEDEIAAQAERRGSMEETRRILKEIDKINMALGYTKRTALTFPRLTVDGYFYPRQDFRPEFLTKTKLNRHGNQKVIHPFKEQNFYYPAPYLHTPLRDAPMKFLMNNPFTPVYPIRFNSNSIKMNHKNKKSMDDDSVRLGTIIVLPNDHREGRSEDKDVVEIKPKGQKIKNKKQKEEEEYNESSIIEELAEYEALGIPEALGIAEDDDDEEEEDDEKQVLATTTALPVLVNDKFLNVVKKGENDNEEDEEEDIEDYVEVGNFTKKFTFTKQDDGLKESTTDKPMDELDYQEIMEEQQENKDDEKSPFGAYLRPKEQAQLFKEGGLIIQRLRVRHGGIAIAGPGGVATAGSGGTAIVGPNGTAYTHPRGLVLAGPGARVYSVPESTNLQELALKHTARQLNEGIEGVLVARGPTVFYNDE